MNQLRKSLAILTLAAFSTLSTIPARRGTAAADEPVTNSLGMQLLPIAAGEFEMGLNDRESVMATHKSSAYQREIHGYLESPAFPVRISQDYQISATEVTVGQFRRFVEATGYQTDAERAGESFIFRPNAELLDRFAAVKGHNWQRPGFEQTDQHPVTCVSWNDANAFCDWLSQTETQQYRLPTEAEWEYACRAGTTTCYSCGDLPDELYAIANVADAALHAEYPEDVIRQRVIALQPQQGDGVVYTAPVGSYQPNSWGLYDMHGNVWEWCSDKYSPNIYKEMTELARERGSRQNPQPIVDFQGPTDTPQHQHGDWRSLRGGSWYVAPIQCRSTVRAFADAADAYSYIGFRVVRVPE